MRKTTFTFFLIAVSIFNCCKKDLNSYVLGIDIQSSFNQDSVQVFVDGQSLINRRLQTNYVLGVCNIAGQTTTTKIGGNYEIKVIINNTTIKTETFSLNNNLYIGVNYS